MSTHTTHRTLAALCAALATAATLSAATLYVTPTGAGGGSSWGDATSLTSALAIATAVDEIWLATGTYTSGVTFTVPADRKLYGGFTTAMTLFTERDATANPTTLDGQAANRRVVSVTGGNVILDGLRITNSNGSSAGGISKTVSGSLTLANCRIADHTAGHGAGVYTTSGNLTMTNCVIDNNRAFNTGGYAPYNGYGVYAYGATPDIQDCVFSNQSAAGGFNNRDGRGAALYMQNGQVLRTEFVNNQAAPQCRGGAVSVYGTATFTNCAFRGNGAGATGIGGALHKGAGTSLTVVNCSFTANGNVGAGGAVYGEGGTIAMRNCILWGNSVAAGGSGSEINVGSGSATVTYSDLSGLSVPHVVGAVTLTNCISVDPLFASATDLHLKSDAGRWDPAAQAFVTTDIVYSACIDAGDPADAIGAEPTDNGNSRINMGAYGGTSQASKTRLNPAPTVTDGGALVSGDHAQLSATLTNGTLTLAAVTLYYGLIDGGTTPGSWDASVALGSQVNGVPFATWTPSLSPSTTYHYRWYATNNGGSVWTADATFATGAAPAGGGANVIHVDQDATGAADGTSWAHAYTTIADGFAAIGGSRTTVWITGDTYAEGRQMTLATTATVVGGFNGTETATSQRPTDAGGTPNNYTVIDGEDAHPGLKITAGDVSVETIECTNTRYSWAQGGALQKSGAGTLTLTNCRVTDSRTYNYQSYGVGCYFTAGTVIMTDCLVADNAGIGNTWNHRGMGIYSVGATLTMTDCLVSGNDNAGGGGGNTRSSRGFGLYFDNGTLTVDGTEFEGNSGGANNGDGGGTAVYLGANANLSASFSHCLFRNNTALAGGTGRGGAVWADLNAAGTASFVNCNFTGNTNATTDGRGGAICQSGGTMTVKNSILWGNQCTGSGGLGNEISLLGGAMTVSYSDLSGLTSPDVHGTPTLNSCIAADPRFASATDQHLQSEAGRWDPVTQAFVLDPATSACIDAGDPADPIGAEPTDNGNSIINMGIYGGTAEASKTQGVPAPQLTDRGAVVSFDRANISGELTNPGSVLADVTLYYGLTDGGTPPGTWDASISLGGKTEGVVFSQWTPSLSPSTTYHYRWYATNAGGSDLTADATFTTGTAPVGGGAGVIHVDLNATGAGDGTSWGHAFTTITAGLAAVGGANTTVWITGDTYAEGSHLVLGTTATVIGGFTGTETDASQRPTDGSGTPNNYTIVDGENSHAGINITGGDVSIETVTFSEARFSWGNGAGLRKTGSGTLSLTNCRFLDAESYSYSSTGLGCSFTGGTVVMTDCVVSGNAMVGNAWANYGVGIYAVGTTLTMVDCLVSDNTGDGFGSRSSRGFGLYFDNGTLSVTGTDFVANAGGASHGDGGGGGIYLGANANLSATFTNCVVRDNVAIPSGYGPGLGGGVWANLNAAGSASFENCTFTGNQNPSGGNGGAIYQNGGTLNIKNCILWANQCTGGGSGHEIAIGGSTTTIAYSDLTGLSAPYIVGGTPTMSNNISADPLFAGATDVHLQSQAGRWDPLTEAFVLDAATSPAIDAGDPADSIGDEPTDNGNSIINMGAYGGTAEASKTFLVCDCEALTSAVVDALCGSFGQQPPTTTAEGTARGNAAIDTAFNAAGCPLDDPCRQTILDLLGL